MDGCRSRIPEIGAIAGQFQRVHSSCDTSVREHNQWGKSCRAEFAGPGFWGGVLPLSAFEFGLAVYSPRFPAAAGGVLSYLPLAIPGVAPLIAFLCNLYLIQKRVRLTFRGAVVQLVVLAMSIPFFIGGALIVGLGTGMLVEGVALTAAVYLGSSALAVSFILGTIVALPLACLAAGFTMGRWFAAIQQHLIGSDFQSAKVTLKAHALGGALTGLLLGVGWMVLTVSRVPILELPVRRMLPFLVLSLFPHAISISRLSSAGESARGASFPVIGRMAITTLGAAVLGLGLSWVWNHLTHP